MDADEVPHFHSHLRGTYAVSIAFFLSPPFWNLGKRKKNPKIICMWEWWFAFCFFFSSHSSLGKLVEKEGNILSSVCTSCIILLFNVVAEGCNAIFFCLCLALCHRLNFSSGETHLEIPSTYTNKRTHAHGSAHTSTSIILQVFFFFFCHLVFFFSVSCFIPHLHRFFFHFCLHSLLFFWFSFGIVDVVLLGDQHQHQRLEERKQIYSYRCDVS